MIQDKIYPVGVLGCGSISDDERLYREAIAIHDINNHKGTSSEIMRYLVHDTRYKGKPYTKRVISMVGGNPTTRRQKPNLGFLLGALGDYHFDQDYLDNIISSLFEKLDGSSMMDRIATEVVTDSYRQFLYPSNHDDSHILSGDVVSIYGRDYRRIPVVGDMGERPLNEGNSHAMKYLFDMGQIGHEIVDGDKKYIYIIEDQIFINELKKKKGMI